MTKRCKTRKKYISKMVLQNTSSTLFPTENLFNHFLLEKNILRIYFIFSWRDKFRNVPFYYNYYNEGTLNELFSGSLI